MNGCRYFLSEKINIRRYMFKRENSDCYRTGLVMSYGKESVFVIKNINQVAFGRIPINFFNGAGKYPGVIPSNGLVLS